MFTIVVTGSRGWNEWGPIKGALDPYKDQEVTLINGTARGADKMCAWYARRLGFTVVDMPAEWDKYGRAAGYKRNEAMLNMKPDLVLAFWDGESRGTQHTINLATQMGLPLRVVRSDGDASS